MRLEDRLRFPRECAHDREGRSEAGEFEDHFARGRRAPDQIGNLFDPRGEVRLGAGNDLIDIIVAGWHVGISIAEVSVLP